MSVSGKKKKLKRKVGLTGDGKIPEQLVRVGRPQKLDKVNVGILPTNDGGHIEVLKVVQGAAQLQRLNMVLEPCRKIKPVVGLSSLLLVDGKSLGLDLVHCGLHGLNCGRRHCDC